MTRLVRPGPEDSRSAVRRQLDHDAFGRDRRRRPLAPPRNSGRHALDRVAVVAAPLDFDTGHAELQSHALAGRIEEAQAAAEAFLGRISRHRPQAVASAMRPLD